MKKALLSLEIGLCIWLLQWIKLAEALCGILILGTHSFNWFSRVAEKTVGKYGQRPIKRTFFKSCGKVFFKVFEILNKEL